MHDNNENENKMTEKESNDRFSKHVTRLELVFTVVLTAAVIGVSALFFRFNEYVQFAIGIASFLLFYRLSEPVVLFLIWKRNNP